MRNRLKMGHETENGLIFFPVKLNAWIFRHISETSLQINIIQFGFAMGLYFFMIVQAFQSEIKWGRGGKGFTAPYFFVLIRHIKSKSE